MTAPLLVSPPSASALVRSTTSVRPAPVRSDPARRVDVVIASAQPLMRCGLRHVLNSEAGFRVVGEAKSVREAGQLIVRVSPHVVLLDLFRVPVTGAQLERMVASAGVGHAVRIVALTDGSDRREPGDIGALTQVIDRNSDPEVIGGAVRRAAGVGFARPVVRPVTHCATSPTAREREVLRCLATGLSNRAIGSALGISGATVKFHVRSLLRKFGAQNRTELAILAARAGIADI